MILDEEINNMPFFHSFNCGADKPFNFEQVKETAKREFNSDFSNPEKIVLIGNRLY